MGQPASFEDLRTLARRRLPAPLFDYIDGGAFDEETCRRNLAAFTALTLRQQVLTGTMAPDTSTELLGQVLSMPLLLGPAGLAGLFARRGEAQAARAAAKAGIPFCLSMLSTCDRGEVEAASGAQPWFQLYLLNDRVFLATLLARLEPAVTVLIVTVDTPVNGVRYRDLRSDFWQPGSVRTALRRAGQALQRPGWTWDTYWRGRPHSFGNLVDAMPPDLAEVAKRQWIARNLKTDIGWADLEWLRGLWKGLLVVKGILEPDDARAAFARGADGIIVSNHGGRQLDGVSASLNALPRIRDAVGSERTVLLDGGIRSGLDMLKALALGADACLVGRAWIFAVAALGEAGVAAMIAMIRRDLEVAMVLTGCRSLADIDPQIIRRRGDG